MKTSKSLLTILLLTFVLNEIHTKSSYKKNVVAPQKKALKNLEMRNLKNGVKRKSVKKIEFGKFVMDSLMWLGFGFVVAYVVFSVVINVLMLSGGPNVGGLNQLAHMHQGYNVFNIFPEQPFSPAFVNRYFCNGGGLRPVSVPFNWFPLFYVVLCL